MFAISVNVALYLCERLIAVSKVAQPMHVGPHSTDMCHFCKTTAAEALKTDVKGVLLMYSLNIKHLTKEALKSHHISDSF